MFSYIFLTVLFACAQAKFYTDCGSKLATVDNVGVSGCAENAKECVLRRNSNVSISVDFTPSVDATGLETVVHGVIMNLPVPFPLPQPDACKDSGLSCPLKAGDKESYRTTMPILKSYPKLRVEVKWELKNQDGDDLVCIMIPARIN